MLALPAGAAVVTQMRVVTPFRPFPAESIEHRALGPFDWIGAIEMLRVSVRRACGCDTVAITDVDTDLPGPTFKYRTLDRRLMIWILEVSRCYLASDDFDRDTVMCSPDMLVFEDLRRWFIGGVCDIGIVFRPGHPDRPILNALQWWPVASRMALVKFYTDAIELAKTLPDDLIVWGADSEPFRQLLQPMRPGIGKRLSGIVVNLIDSRSVMKSLTRDMIDALENGLPVDSTRAVMDFRYLRKRHMRAFFDATIGAGQPAERTI